MREGRLGYNCENGRYVSRGTEVKLDAVAKKIVELQKKDPLSNDTGCAASDHQPLQPLL